MIRSSGASWALLAATLWLPVYAVLFVGSVLAIVLSGSPGPEPGGWFAGIFVVHLLSIGVSIGLLVVYLLDVLKNDELASGNPNDRVIWLVLVVLTGFIGQIIYWWMHLRPSSDAFRRRLAGETRPPPGPGPGPGPGWSPPR